MDISDGKFMTCGRCDNKYCFENPDYNNKCGGYTKKSWASIGKQKKKGKVRCTQCKEEGHEDDESENEDLDLKSQLSQILKVVKNVEKEIKEVRKEQQDLKEFVDMVNAKYDELQVEQKKNKEDVKAMEKTVRVLSENLREKEEVIASPQKRLLETETYSPFTVRSTLAERK